jgi:hypothetical protein
VTAERETSRETPPPPRRGRWWRWLLVIVGVLLVVVIAGVAILLHLSGTGALTDDALRLANRLITQNSNMDLAARRVIRTPTGVRLEEVSIAVVEPGRRTRLVFAQRADIYLAVWPLLRGRGQTYRLHFTEPLFTLTFDDSGRAILPTFEKRQGPKQPPRDGLQVVLERARFEVKDRQGIVQWLEQGSLAAELLPSGPGYDITLQRGAGRIPPLGLVVQKMEGSAATGRPGLELHSLLADPDAGAVRLSGGWWIPRGMRSSTLRSGRGSSSASCSSSRRCPFPAS